MDTSEWTEGEMEEQEYPVNEYDLTSMPNDFNILTLVNFIDSGVVKIPGFQRNYVWDLTRASKLIESLIIGLPVPQIYFFEEKKNSYLVIDGQQRLMTIYYFIKERFPKIEKRIEIRRIFSEKGYLPPEIINDDVYFSKFNLSLKTYLENVKNKFDKKNYDTLGDYKISFGLKTIRSIVVKPATDTNDDSALYELFNRLNTGGVNLSPQEIRVSLYDSKFMRLLIELNNDKRWRKFVGVDIDLHLKDVEILLRSFAMLFAGTQYIQPLSRFINNFAKNMKTAKDETIEYTKTLFNLFLDKIKDFDENIFRTANNKFRVVLFESVLYTVCKDAVENHNNDLHNIDEAKLLSLSNSKEFTELTVSKSTNTEIIKKRLDYVYHYIRR